MIEKIGSSSNELIRIYFKHDGIDSKKKTGGRYWHEITNLEILIISTIFVEALKLVNSLIGTEKRTYLRL